jgi:thiol-disulfide isomerase/thioredoxin
LRKQTVKRLRAQLANRSDAAALAAWPVLWQLEFQLVPASDHPQLRKEVSADAAKLRHLEGRTNLRLQTLRQGYRLAEDPVGARWAQEELMRVAPSSRAAAEATVEVWQDENPYPRNGQPEERLAYERVQLAASAVWVERWPNFELACQPRLTALLSLPELPPQRVAELGKGVLACMQRNPDFTFGFTDPPTLRVAERLAKAGVELSLVREAVALGLKRSEQRLQSDLAAGGGPMGAAQARAYSVIDRWLGRRIGIAADLRSKRIDQAKSELETYRKEVAAADPTDRLTLWPGLTGLVAAGIDAGRKDIARETLRRMSGLLAEDPPSKVPREAVQRSQREAEYWKWKATLAEDEGRKLDAVAYYRRAAEAAPGDFNPQERLAMIAAVQRVWNDLGGTAEAFEAWSSGSVVQATRWVSTSRQMPAFSLQDLEGQSFRLADLGGKTLFINVWATWCGPCQAELPQVQRLYDRFKERGDVRVLTLNIDDNPGIVNRYMKQHGYSFPALLARDFVEGQLQVETIPRNWIVDGKGVLRLERQAGADESFFQDVLTAIAEVSGK